jgi:hypothetical protein
MISRYEYLKARLPGMIPAEHCDSEIKIMEILEEYLGLVRCLYLNFMYK